MDDTNDEFLDDPDAEEIKIPNLNSELLAELREQLKAELREELRAEFTSTEVKREEIDRSEFLANPILHKRYKITGGKIVVGGQEQGSQISFIEGIATKADLILAGCDFDWLIRSGAIQELDEHNV